MNNMDNRELMSALADGQLEGEEVARGVALAASDAHAREAWCTYHLVSEALRTGRVSTGSAPDAFLARLQRRLKEEAVMPAAAPALAQPVAAPLRLQPAANDWRWKIAAGVASVAAVAAVGWNVWSSSDGRGQPQLAAAPAAVPALAQASAAPMTRDERLDRLLAAHRQFGGGTALGGSSAFLRNATFEGPAR